MRAGYLECGSSKHELNMTTCNRESMKTSLRNLYILPVLIAGLAQTGRPAVTFSVTPAAVSNSYNGTITLQIGGLTNRETVVIQKYLDVNTNGVIDANDLMVQQFQLIVGQTEAIVIGGVTNVNVPFNSNRSAERRGGKE